MDLSQFGNIEGFGDGNPFGDPAWYQGSNSPYYNETHKVIRKVCRDFVESDVFDKIGDWDEEKKIPAHVNPTPFPDKYINKPQWLDFKPDYFHEMIIFDEMSRTGSGGFMWGIAGGLTIGLPPIYKWGTDAMKDKVVGPCLKGEKVICLCVTEPTAGSDVANIRTTAKKSEDGTHYIVNGEKKWITNGVFADYFTVVVRTGGPGHKGLSFMLLEKGMKGITTRQMNCSGVWSSGTTYIEFRNVKVPCENLIGKENQAFPMIMKNFNHERWALCCMTNRFSRVLYEEAYKFSLKRKTFGKKLFDNQLIKWKLAEMARQIESTHAWLENITHQASSKIEKIYKLNTMSPIEADFKLGGTTALLKAHCTKVMEYCARESAQIFGGLSYTRSGLGEKTERLNREVRAMAIPGGSEEIMLELAIKQSQKVAEFAKQILDSRESMAGDSKL
eukprot:gene1054-734_t